MKTKKKSALCSGQQLLSGYFRKNLKQVSQNEATDEKKSASTLVRDTVDLSDDDIVPPTQRHDIQTPVFSKCAFSAAPRSLRTRSSPLKHPPKGPSARLGLTLRPPKRKFEDDVDSCATVAAKPLSSIQTSNTLSSSKTLLHSPQVFKRKENIPWKEPPVPLEKSEEKQTAKEAHASVAVVDDVTWFDLDSSKDLDFGDDWGMDDIGLKHERKKGMDVSLFARLEHLDNTMVLPVQYRMNREITAVCNGLTYAGQLQCGSEDVANASLSLPNLSTMLDQELPEDSWMLKAVSSELDKAVMFVCTDALTTSQEDRSSTNGDCNNNKSNNSSSDEAKIVRQLVHILLKAGVAPEEVGVIAPFRNQVRLLKQECSSVPQVDISTVDQFQGKEKSVVLFSCVKKYTGDSKDAEILNDQRRLTVAVSRAKHKLIIIGSSSTVKKYKPFEKLLSLLREDQFIKLQAGDESRCE